MSADNRWCEVMCVDSSIWALSKQCLLLVKKQTHSFVSLLVSKKEKVQELGQDTSQFSNYRGWTLSK